MGNRALAACAEFPNDNPALHGGAIWSCRGVVGPATFEPPEMPVDEESVEAAAAEAGPPAEAASEPVLELDLEPVFEAAPQPSIEAASEPETDPAPPVLDADDPGDDIEIVDDLELEGPVEEANAAPSAAPPADDPFAALVQVIEDTARDAGAGDAAMAALRVILGRDRLTEGAPESHAAMRGQAAAWQAILRGESEDFSGCGAATLDEWSAIVVAGALGQPARVDPLRRELRRRGVAAFGLVLDAA